MGTDESAVLPSAVAANTRRRIAEKSTPVAIATQEGFDGYREKAPLWRSVAEQSRWVEPEESKSSHS